jgi:hypothetical protein
VIDIDDVLTICSIEYSEQNRNNKIPDASFKLAEMESERPITDPTERRRKSLLLPSFGLRRSSVSTYAKCRSDYSSSLITSKEWRLLREYLNTFQGSTELSQLLTDSLRPNGLRRHSLHDTRETTGTTLLHTCCQLHPPADILTRMVQLCPLVANQRDSFGRYPLHVAAAFGASPQVIKFLILQNEAAASRPDFEGKTPLHLYCEYGCFEGICDPGKDYSADKSSREFVKGPVLQVLFDLFTAAPKSIIMEDNGGMTPLENVITLGADDKVINFLQKLSEYMVKREANSGRGAAVSTTEHVLYAKHVLRISMRSPKSKVDMDHKKIEILFCGEDTVLSNQPCSLMEKQKKAPLNGLLRSRCRRLSLPPCSGATQNKCRRLSLPNPLLVDRELAFRNFKKPSSLASKGQLAV